MNYLRQYTGVKSTTPCLLTDNVNSLILLSVPIDGQYCALCRPNEA